MGSYALPVDDLLQLATAITGSAEDPMYVAEGIRREDASKGALLTTATGWILAEFSEKVKPAAVALIFQYLDEALSGVTIEGNDTDDFSSPAFSQTLTIPAKRFDGPTYQRWTYNLIEELDEIEDPDGYLFWRLNFDDANSQPIQIGRWMLPSQLRPVDLMHAPGDIGEDDELVNIVNVTEAKVRRVREVAGPRRGLTFAIVCTDLGAGTAGVDAAADFRALKQSSNGGLHPFLFVPFDLEPWLVYIESIQIAHAQGGYQVWTVTLREVARPLPFP